MRLIHKLLRRFGRKAKKWLESLFSGYDVERKENREKQISRREKHNDETSETRRHFHAPWHFNQPYRMGYGAMQLAGPEVWGPPRDVDAAIAVLREPIAAGVNYLDTSDYYGPQVTNQIIKKALHPYPDSLVIVTKLAARRGGDESWIPAFSRQDLIDGTHDNPRNLGVDRLDVVNLRVGAALEPSEGSIEEPLTALAELKRQELIGHIGLSNVTPRQLEEAQRITEIVCVQNFYNVARRGDDAFISKPSPTASLRPSMDSLASGIWWESHLRSGEKPS